MAEVRAMIRELLDELPFPVRRMLVAFSGGPDSTALLLHLHSGFEPLELVAVHVNHHLRGDESDQDERWSRDYAERLGIRLDVLHVDLDPGIIRRSGIEAAAREARYEALESARDRLGCDAIATAHTLEDQAETVLMRLLAHSSVPGLRGILPVRGRIIRPVLGVPRVSLHAILAENGIEPRIDPMNFDRRYLRASVRHELLPWLRARSPLIDEQLASMATAVHSLAIVAGGRLDGIEPEWRRTRRTSAFPLESLPQEPWLRDELFARELRRHRPGGRNIRTSLFRDPSRLETRTSIGEGLEAFVRQGEVVIADRPLSIPPWCHPLSVGETRELPEIAASVRIEPDDAVHALMTDPMRTTQLIGLDSTQPKIEIRNRRAGDRFQPLGMEGHRKLKDVLIDRRVPPAERDEMPLVIIDGEIAWIPGVEVSERFRVRDGRERLRVSIDYANRDRETD